MKIENTPEILYVLYYLSSKKLVILVSPPFHRLKNEIIKTLIQLQKMTQLISELTGFKDSFIQLQSLYNCYYIKLFLKICRLILSKINVHWDHFDG